MKICYIYSSCVKCYFSKCNGDLPKQVVLALWEILYWCLWFLQVIPTAMHAILRHAADFLKNALFEKITISGQNLHAMRQLGGIYQ